MAGRNQITVMAVSSYFKGEDFMREAKRQGARVLLLAQENLKDAPWPHDSIDEFFLTPNMENHEWVFNTVGYLCRSRQIDRIIPLDEYDVELAAQLREHLQIAGMGVSATHRFRDKLLMRLLTREAGIPVPDFVQVLNYDDLRDYMNRVAAPWVLKPRTEAGAMGIKKLQEAEEMWRALDALGDRQTDFLLEQFVPGDVYHVDSIIWDGEIVFASAQKYGQPPMTVAHGGGVFMSYNLPRDAQEVRALEALNKRVVKVLGMTRGVTHAEFIRAQADGQFYFLEIAGRVGGAHLADLVEAATGVNLWREWANVTIADAKGVPYELPPLRERYAGLLVCLARQEWPDLSAYDDAEVVWRLHKQQHAGLIVASPDADRVQALLGTYVERFGQDFSRSRRHGTSQRRKVFSLWQCAVRI